MPDLNRSGMVVGYIVEIISSASDHRRSSSCFGCAPARSQNVAASATPAPHCEVVHTLSPKHEPSTGGFVMAGVPPKDGTRTVPNPRSTDTAGPSRETATARL